MMKRKRLREPVVTPEELKAPTKPRPARKVVEERITHWQKLANTHIDAKAANATEKSDSEEREEESAEEFKARRETFVEEVRELLSKWPGRLGQAKKVLERLASIQNHLVAFDSSREPGELMEAIREAMWGWDDVYSLTMWIHENEIWTIPDRMREGASEGGQKRAAKTKLRNIAMAQEFLERWEKSGKKSRSALMEEIGKEHGLERTQSIHVINKELKRRKSAES